MTTPAETPLNRFKRHLREGTECAHEQWAGFLSALSRIDERLWKDTPLGTIKERLPDMLSEPGRISEEDMKFMEEQAALYAAYDALGRAHMVMVLLRAIQADIDKAEGASKC
jgi:hypothetical protein